MKSKKIMLYLHSVTREVNMAVKSWDDPKKTGKLEFFNQGRHNKFRNFSRFAGAVQKNRKT